MIASLQATCSCPALQNVKTVSHLISTNRGQVLKRDLLPNIAVEVVEPTDPLLQLVVMKWTLQSALAAVRHSVPAAKQFDVLCMNGKCVKQLKASVKNQEL